MYLIVVAIREPREDLIPRARCVWLIYPAFRPSRCQADRVTSESVLHNRSPTTLGCRGHIRSGFYLSFIRYWEQPSRRQSPSLHPRFQEEREREEEEKSVASLVKVSTEGITKITAFVSRTESLFNTNYAIFAMTSVSRVLTWVENDNMHLIIRSLDKLQKTFVKRYYNSSEGKMSSPSYLLSVLEWSVDNDNNFIHDKDLSDI